MNETEFEKRYIAEELTTDMGDVIITFYKKTTQKFLGINFPKKTYVGQLRIWATSVGLLPEIETDDPDLEKYLKKKVAEK